jgi:hypothetical protein
MIDFPLVLIPFAFGFLIGCLVGAFLFGLASREESK